MSTPRANIIGFIKSFVLFLSLLAVICSSFWVSYLLGSRILLPVKNLPERKIEVVMNEPSPSLAVLEEFDEAKATNLDESPSPQKKTYLSDKTEKSYYKVQAGTYNDKDQAISTSKKLNSSGFHTYLRKVSEGWRVQVGAFTEKVEALGLQDILKGKGFSSTLIYE